MGRLGLRAKSRSTPVAGIGEGPTVPGHLPGRPRSRSGRFPPVAARDDLHEVLEVVRFQADGCARAGSPLYATILDGVAADLRRSEERRVGKECVSTCRSRWSPYP